MKLSIIKNLAAFTDDWRVIVEANLDVEKVVSSLSDGTINDVSCLLSDDYFEDDSYYYDKEYYVLDYYGYIILLDDAGFCEGYEEYFPSYEIIEVDNGRSYLYYSEKYINNNNDEIYIYNNRYYTENGLDYNYLVIMSDGEIEHTDNVYYWDSDGEYHYEPEDNYTYVRGYHNSHEGCVSFGDDTFKIGFEIEKEDQDVKESISIRDFESEFPKWRKERDGSLDEDSGYELVSPVFDLVPEKIKEYILNEGDILLNHINASKSNRCGGHVNLSMKGVSGSDFFDRIKGYLPLIYALYYGRVTNTYCLAKASKKLKDGNEKMQAVRIHNNRIEFRIVSAVPDLDTLVWRAELFKMLCDNLTDCPVVAFNNVHTILDNHLKKVYNDSEKFSKLIQRIVKYTKEFEEIELSINR